MGRVGVGLNYRSPNSRRLLEGGGGGQRLSDPTTKTLICGFLNSCTKNLTAIMIAMAKDNGLLDYGDKIREGVKYISNSCRHVHNFLTPHARTAKPVFLKLFFDMHIYRFILV